MEILIYTTQSCPYCHKLKDFLTSNNYNYTEINLTLNPEKINELLEKTKQTSVPVTVIDNEIILGYDLDALKKEIRYIIMIYDLIIIGGGPAGITAAIYAARKNINFLFISEDIGGQVAKSSLIENYTGFKTIDGVGLTKKFTEHLETFDFEQKNETVVNITKEQNIIIVKTKKNDFRSKTVIIATGAKPRKLNIKGESEYTNKGVTYCATCDAPLFKNKDVVVIGGGNSGVEAVIQLLSIANKIYLVERNNKLLADQILQDKVVNNSKVKIFYNSEINEISGSNFVEKIIISQDKKENELNVQGVFINIGYIANTSLINNNILTNSWGEIIVDKYAQTNIDGIYAAGDCTNIPYKQIVISAGHGSIAALSAYKYLINQ